MSWLRYLTFISLVSYQIKSTALLVGSSPGKCEKPHWAATYRLNLLKTVAFHCQAYRLFDR